VGAPADHRDPVAKKLPLQDALPFPPTPSASVAGLTMQESVYERRVEPRRLPEDSPNIFMEKVITNGRRNGSYHWASSQEEARRALDAQPCGCP
jgi:hypothetical protein